MKKVLILVLPLLLFIMHGCASTQKQINKDDDTTTMYTVKVVNSSGEKVALRYQNTDLTYTFRFVDQKNEIKFLMNGNLTVQYSQIDYDNAKIIKIKQDTFIHVKDNDIIIDDLPVAEKIKPENKVLEKSK